MMYPCMAGVVAGGPRHARAQRDHVQAVPANEQGELQGALASMGSITSIVAPLLMTSLFPTSPAVRGAGLFPRRGVPRSWRVADAGGACHRTPAIARKMPPGVEQLP